MNKLPKGERQRRINECGGWFERLKDNRALVIAEITGYNVNSVNDYLNVFLKQKGIKKDGYLILESKINNPDFLI